MTVARYMMFSVVLMFSALPVRLLLAQDTWDRYQPRTLREIVDSHLETMLDTRAPPDIPQFVVLADDFPSRVRVVYTGESRQIPAFKVELIRRWATSLRIDPRALQAFKTEYLFREDSTEFWLPVQEVLIPYLNEEVEPGAAVTLYTQWVGAHVLNAEVTWVFLVNEFQAEGE